MYSVVKEFILPPGSLIVLLTVAFLLVLLKKRAAGLSLGAVSLAAFYLLATPVVAARLNAFVQTVPAASDTTLRAADAQAIVVLSAGLSPFSAEYGGPTADEITLQRLRYAARIHRATSLPILVSGGRPPGATTTLAAVMQESLRNDFGVDVRWLEDRSLDTYENAVHTAALFKANQVTRVILVTHATHMPRAVRMFTQAGLSVTPAPTAFIQAHTTTPTSYVPRMGGLRDSHYAVYEMAGNLWYALRH